MPMPDDFRPNGKGTRKALEAEPLISIIVCCYNRERFLHSTLKSALAQDYGNFEVIVMDDGSTDNTPEVISEFGPAIRYIRQTNQGIAMARTNACLQSRGELIAFLDDDDLMPEYRLTCLSAALVQYPGAVCAVGGVTHIDENSEPTGRTNLPMMDTVGGSAALITDSLSAVLWPRLPVLPHTTLFRRSDGERIGWFDPQFKYASEDKDFFARLAKLGPFVYVPRVVSFYRRGHRSLTANEIRTHLTSLALFTKHLEQLDATATALDRRLRERILKASKKISFLLKTVEGQRSNLPRQILQPYIQRLRTYDRLRYEWYVRAELPIRSHLGRRYTGSIVRSADE